MSKKTILCIEHPPEMVELIRRVLEYEQVDLQTAKSGQEGLEFARQQKPDLILLGVRLPDKDGWEILEQIKTSGELGNIPIIMLTQPIPPGIDRTLPKMLPNASVVKPFSPQQLIDTIRQVLN
ncbi:MAG: response regulator [Planctomycetes bacterium]|nr:response regulator [Planctomycetota bacterium]